MRNMVLIGVVPIFMSAGAAVLPTVLAAVASVMAILLKPREVIRICRERPKTVAITFAAFIVITGGGVWWWLSPDSASAATATDSARSASRYDWVAIANNIIEQEKAGKLPTAIDIKPLDSAVVLGRDYSRCSFDGGTSPEKLVRSWTYHPPKSWFISATVAGDRIYVGGATILNEQSGAFACLDTRTGNPAFQFGIQIPALNPNTGKPTWKMNKVNGQSLHPLFSCPAITQDGKYLLVGEGFHEDENCQLRCLDAISGEFRWSVKTPLHIESSPAIFGDRVVVGCGAIEDDSHKAKGDPGHVICVRISDGMELWRVPVNDPESSPAIDDAGMVYIGSGFNGSAVVAIRSEPDEQLREKHLDRIAWRTPVAQPVTSAITLAGDLVIAGAGNSDFVYADPHPEGWVVALEKQTGKVRWQTKFPDAVLGAIAVRDGKAICPVRTGEVAALDLADGHILWRTAISGTAPVLAGCAFTGSRVYAVSCDGYLAVLDAGDGKILQKIYINDGPGENHAFCGPQVVGGRVMVGSETGGMRCYVGGVQ